MDQPTVLRTTKIGNGFIKEDVLAYVDELNSKIYALEEECNDLKEKLNNGGGLSDDAVKQYEAELSRLRGELGTTKNQLRAAQDELKNRPVIGADGEGGASAAELDAAKQQLAAANERNDSLTTQVEAMKADVERLTEENQSLRSDLSAAAVQALGSGEDAAKVAALTAQLADATAEIESLKGELDAKDIMLEEQSGLSNESDLAQITALTAQVAEKDAAIAEKDNALTDAQKKIAELEAQVASQNKQIADLKSNDGMSAMSALFMQAQELTNKATADAKADAERITREAKEQAESILSEANAQAEQTVTSANAQAEEVVSAANAQADTTIANANAQADATISSANAEAERTLSEAHNRAAQTVMDAEESVRAKIEDADRRSKMTTDTAVTVRALLRSEIDAVAKKISEATHALKELQDQTNARMGEAKDVIAKAKDAVSDSDELPSFASFDEVASHSFSKGSEEKKHTVADESAQTTVDLNDGWTL